MVITEKVSGIPADVSIELASDEDFKLLTVKRHAFNWKKYKGYAVYKLRLVGSDDIIGAMLLDFFPNEQRIEIKLLAVSIENKGSGKQFEGIAGCMIAYTCRMALLQYGVFACVSLTPKTKLKQHYLEKYGMIDAGKQIYLDGKRLINIIKKYIP
jgi:hypothetical protein